MIVIGHRVFVDVTQRTFLGANTASEITEVIKGERNVGIQCLPDGLTVVHRLGVGQ